MVEQKRQAIRVAADLVLLGQNMVFCLERRIPCCSLGLRGQTVPLMEKNRMGLAVHGATDQAIQSIVAIGG
ncbi:hypothetical protein BB779_19050 [Pseudomonas viridiflava]|nr:hypothetical protein BB779_19050 [Pseudomonas viridiflava]